GSGPVDHGGLDGRGGVIPLMYVVVQKSCRRHVCVGASGLSLHGFSPGSGEARTPPPILVSRALWRGLEQAWSVSGQTAPSLRRPAPRGLASRRERLPRFRRGPDRAPSAPQRGAGPDSAGPWSLP